MSTNKTIALDLTKQQQDSLFTHWESFGEVKHPQNTYYQLKLENAVITAYLSGKTVFQGKDAEVYASMFMKESKNPFPQAGSDEVGTGDYFGPVCVTACVIEEKNQSLLQELQTGDSKKITDKDILKIAPILEKKIPHSSVILLPEKYNQVHKSNNLNEIKAKLHNQAYINLKKKVKKLPSFIIIDQFAEEGLYYHYLKNEKEIIRNIHFETKAEDKYEAVGVSSILARYAFLQTFEKMKKLYDMDFQKGSGHKADLCAKEFIEQYGFENLYKVAKLHFKNTEKVKEL